MPRRPVISLAWNSRRGALPDHHRCGCGSNVNDGNWALTLPDGVQYLVVSCADVLYRWLSPYRIAVFDAYLYHAVQPDQTKA